MANELRVRQNFIGGIIEDNPLLAGATSFQSNGLAAVVAIGSTQHFPIVLDPDGLYGEPEVAYVTAHTAGAVTATILRGQEGTTARQHQQDINWTHGPSVRDIAGDGWTAMTLQNSWVAYGTDGGGTYSTPSYSLDGNGIVRLKGLLKNGTATDGTIIGSVPSGYRPSENKVFPIWVGTSGGTPRINLYGAQGVGTGQSAPGNLVIFGINSSTILSIDNISYRVEA